jgi:hypothetical protein
MGVGKLKKWFSSSMEYIAERIAPEKIRRKMINKKIAATM